MSENSFGNTGCYTGIPQHFDPVELGEVETQQSIGTWAEATFPGGDPHSPVHALRVLDEVIELCRAAGASWQQIYAVIDKPKAKSEGDGGLFSRGYPEPANVPGEAADVAITLNVLAHRRGFDLARGIRVKMVTNRYDRGWISNGDGTGRHIDHKAQN